MAKDKIDSWFQHGAKSYNLDAAISVRRTDKVLLVDFGTGKEERFMMTDQLVAMCDARGIQVPPPSKAGAVRRRRILSQ